MYSFKNYPTKKALVDDFKAGVEIMTYQAGGFFPAETDGSVVLEGPHYPEPHKWYASVTIKDGVVTKINR